MGARGPAPLPTAIQELRGNPGKRALNRNEPQPARVAPRIPELVKADERARKHWKRMVPLLLKMRVLSEADGVALGSLCLDLSVLEQAQSKLQQSGLLIRTKSGMLHQNPLLQIISDAADRVSKGLREFGMTPSSRSRIVVAPERNPDSPWAELRQQIQRGT